MLAMGPGYAKSAVDDVWGLYALHKIFRDYYNNYYYK